MKSLMKPLKNSWFCGQMSTKSDHVPVVCQVSIAGITGALLGGFNHTAYWQSLSTWQDRGFRNILYLEPVRPLFRALNHPKEVFYCQNKGQTGAIFIISLIINIYIYHNISTWRPTKSRYQLMSMTYFHMKVHPQDCVNQAKSMQ